MVESLNFACGYTISHWFYNFWSRVNDDIKSDGIDENLFLTKNDVIVFFKDSVKILKRCMCHITQQVSIKNLFIDINHKNTWVEMITSLLLYLK